MSSVSVRLMVQVTELRHCGRSETVVKHAFHFFDSLNSYGAMENEELWHVSVSGIGLDCTTSVARSEPVMVVIGQAQSSRFEPRRL